jgi:hypothetical protein
MRQRTFSSLGFEVHGKSTRRQRFLGEMELTELLLVEEHHCVEQRCGGAMVRGIELQPLRDRGESG